MPEPRRTAPGSCRTSERGHGGRHRAGMNAGRGRYIGAQSPTCTRQVSVAGPTAYERKVMRVAVNGKGSGWTGRLGSAGALKTGLFQRISRMILDRPAANDAGGTAAGRLNGFCGRQIMVFTAAGSGPVDSCYQNTRDGGLFQNSRRDFSSDQPQATRWCGTGAPAASSGFFGSTIVSTPRATVACSASKSKPRPSRSLSW